MNTSTSPHIPALAMLGPVRQLGYVVQNLDAAVAAWQQQLGLRHWTLMRNIPLQCLFEGEASEPHIDIALAYSGGVQIELIQQRNDAPSPYRSFVETRRFGLHHSAFLCKDINAQVLALQDVGMHLACDINMPMGGRYVYFKSPVPNEQTYIELLEATSMMKQMFALGIAKAAEDQVGSSLVSINMWPLLRMARGLSRLFKPRGSA